VRLSLILVLACWSPVLAQDDAALEAEPLQRTPDDIFDAGVRAMERSDWLAAEVLFREAMEAAPGARTQLNLAEVLFRQGQLLAARTEAMAVLDGSDLLLRDAASMLLERIDGRLAHIRPVPRGLGAIRSEVRIDGRAVDPGVTIAVDPGDHTVTLFGDDRPLAEREVSVRPGEEREVVLEADLSPTAVAAANSTPVLLGGPEARARRRRRLGFGISAGVLAAVAVTLGLAFGLRGDDGSPSGDTEPVVFGGP